MFIVTRVAVGVNNSDVDDPVYKNSSDSSMGVEEEPPTSNFQFDIEKVKAGDYILVELKSDKGNPVHYIIIIKKSSN